MKSFRTQYQYIYIQVSEKTQLYEESSTYNCGANMSISGDWMNATPAMKKVPFSTIVYNGDSLKAWNLDFGCCGAAGPAPAPGIANIPFILASSIVDWSRSLFYIDGGHMAYHSLN